MKRTFSSLAALFTVAFTLLISCQKENQADEIRPSTEITLKEARQWFDENLALQKPLRASGETKNRKSLKKNPDWNRATNKILQVGNTVVVPLAWESDWTPKLRALGATPKFDKNEPAAGLNSLTYLLM